MGLTTILCLVLRLRQNGPVTLLTNMPHGMDKDYFPSTSMYGLCRCTTLSTETHLLHIMSHFTPLHASVLCFSILHFNNFLPFILLALCVTFCNMLSPTPSPGGRVSLVNCLNLRVLTHLLLTPRTRPF
jgi:hypothetical protein